MLDKDLDDKKVEECRLLLEATLNNLTEKADSYFDAKK